MKLKELASFQVAGETETKGQIKLRFKTTAGRDVVCIRSFQLTQKASKLEYKAVESVLQTIDPRSGEVRSCTLMLYVEKNQFQPRFHHDCSKPRESPSFVFLTHPSFLLINSSRSGRSPVFQGAGRPSPFLANISYLLCAAESGSQLPLC